MVACTSWPDDFLITGDIDAIEIVVVTNLRSGVRLGLALPNSAYTLAAVYYIIMPISSRGTLNGHCFKFTLGWAVPGCDLYNYDTQLSLLAN